MPSRFVGRSAIGMRAIDLHPGSLVRLLELSARHEREGLGDAPWPPHYEKQQGEPARVQPSRRRTPKPPLIEIARARQKDDALAGLERWRARHPEAVGAPGARRRARRRHARAIPHMDANPGQSAARAGSAATAEEPLDPDDTPNDWSEVSDVRTGRRAEDLLELVRGRDLELIVAAVGRRLVRAPALKDRGVAEAIALHVVVLHLAHALDPQRLP